MIKGMLLGLFLLPFCALNAQIRVKGRVVAGDSKGLPYADVVLVGNAGEIAHKYCDSLGSFEFVTKAGSAKLSLRASYIRDSSAIIAVDPQKDGEYLVEIRLKHQYSEVTVGSGKRPLIEKKVDRMVYNIEGLPSFDNKSVADILKNIPRVAVSRNNIQLLGKGNVGVMINDRLVYLSGKDLMDYLNLYKGDIVSVEVIPNPPAKYDAEGNGGLINIVTRKGKIRGLFGDLNMDLTRNSYAEAENNLNLKYRNKNLNMSLGLGYSTGAYREQIDQQYIFKDPSLDNWQDQARNKLTFHNWIGSFILEYLLSKKMSINVSYNWSSNRFYNDEHHTIKYFDGAGTDSLGLTTGFDSVKSTLQSASINWHLDLNKGNKLDLYVDYAARTGDDNTRTKTTNYYPDKQNPTNTTIALYSYGNAPKKVFSPRIDLSLPHFLPKFTTELGGKFNYYDNRSKIDYDETANQVSLFQGINTRDTFRYIEKNAAAYISLSRDLGHLSAKAGLRYEGTFTDGRTSGDSRSFHRNYNNLFPTAYLLYTVNKNLTIDGSYARRISRPRIWDVNPYRWYTSIYSYNTGNPALAPSLQDNFEFNIGIKSSYFINLFYNIKHDPILSLPFSMGNYIENLKLNNGRIKNYGANLSASFSLMDKMQNSLSCSIIGYDFTTSYAYTKQKTPVYVIFSGNETYQLTGSVLAGIDLAARLPGGSADITSQTGSYEVGLSIRKSMYKNKLVITLSAQDLFRSGAPDYKTETPGFRSLLYNYYDFQSISVNIKYKFGKELSSAKRKAGLQNAEKMRL